MSTKERWTVAQDELVRAWQRELPRRLTHGDTAEVRADASDPQRLLVTIRAAGRQAIELDFAVRYVDSREIEVTLSDAEEDGATVDERKDKLQQLIADYRRHLHECAQALHELTHA